MELDRFESEMLDAVLEAFGSGDKLSRSQVLDLFALDEELASALIAVLAGDGYVTGMGLSADQALPGFIIRTSAGLSFLQQGGYAGQIKDKPELTTPVTDNDAVALKVLKEENLSLQLSLNEQERKNEVLNAKLKWLRLWQIAVAVSLFIIVALVFWLSHTHHLHAAK